MRPASIIGLALFSLAACALQGRPAVELTLPPATGVDASPSEVTPNDTPAQSARRRGEPAPAVPSSEPATSDRPCEDEGTSCTSDDDCCAAQTCFRHACIACMKLRDDACSLDSQCCRGMLCVQRRCTRCEGVGNAGARCVGQFDCCGTSQCINKVCQACKVSGSACQTYSDCCEGFACLKGTCKACGKTGEKCTDSGSCCGLDGRCLEGYCRKCRRDQEPCESGLDCCGGLVCKARACAPP